MRILSVLSAVILLAMGCNGGDDPAPVPNPVEQGPATVDPGSQPTAQSEKPPAVKPAKPPEEQSPKLDLPLVIEYDLPEVPEEILGPSEEFPET